MFELDVRVEGNSALANSDEKMKTSGFTIEQEAALSAFEAAAESHDLRAFGNSRRFNAHRAVIAAFAKIEALDLRSALTWQEHAQVRDSKAYVAANE